MIAAYVPTTILGGVYTVQQTTLEQLLDLRGADREARAYAVLYAAFKRTEISANPVRDALDCLLPFIGPYTNSITGKQVTSENIQLYLKEGYGFDIPLYAIDQLLTSLQKHGYVEYRKNVRAHFALTHQVNFDDAREGIETDFDEVVRRLTTFAERVGLLEKAPSGTGWGEALLNFLRERPEKPSTGTINVHKVLIKPSVVEANVIGSFLKRLHNDQDPLFEKVLNVFMGVLVEDFISTISSIGTFSNQKPVTAFYDTAVLLRLLGCSGKMLRTATEELTRYLQDIGFKISYFSGNESEVSGILDTLVYVKDAGKEIEGETAEAIALGEITTTELRLMKGTFPERLAKFNIFPAGDLEGNALALAKFQIDEKGFSEFLQRRSLADGRAYRAQNRQNDANFLASVMRLRRGARPRDLADAGYVFITSNRFLASSSRRYLIEQRHLSAVNCPPILSLGQAATIAWLLKDQTIAPEKAGRELLTNCFAAVRPDAEWFGFFREGIEQHVGPLEEYTKSGQNVLTLQAARRIASEESFGNSAIMRVLNMAEILSRAQTDGERILEAERETHARERTQLEQDYESRVKILSETQTEQAQQALRLAEERYHAGLREQEKVFTERERASKLQRADRQAGVVILTIKVVLLGLLGGAIFFVAWATAFASGPSTLLWVASALLAALNAASLADLLGFKLVSRLFQGMKSRISSRLLG